MDIGKLYTTQISLTEWFEHINHKQTAELRREDNEKRHRLKIIHQVTGMPFDEPVQFEAADITDRTPAFTKYLAGHGNDLCALRLIPKDPALPKLRLRGKTVRETVEHWYPQQKIDPADYTADFVPHANLQLFSTIFVVNQRGIFGEIIKGAHYQLTQGFYDDTKPVVFSFDWKTWRFSDNDPVYAKEIKEVTRWLHIPDPHKQAELTTQLNATFSHDYLEGYFETITNGDGIGLWYCDYNRMLGRLFADAHMTQPDAQALVKGQPASRGTASGKVVIVLQKDVANATIADGDVLVCDITTPDYMPLMQKAAAVVTDRGGILSHAAIVCRELGKPCVAATGCATTVLKNGQRVIVDANAGTVTA